MYFFVFGCVLILLSSVRSRGRWGDMSPPVKIVVPPQQRRKIFSGGMPKRPLSDKYRKKLNVFIGVAYGYGLRRYFPAYLVAIMVSFAN